MRVTGLIGVVLALLVVGWLAQRQLGKPVAAVPGVAAGAAPSAGQSTQQLQQDIRQSLDAAAQQQRRAMPEEAN